MVWFKRKKKENDEMVYQNMFDVDKFNNWFNDPNNGSYANPGIFLRMDKLSTSMFEDFFKTFNIKDINNFMNSSHLTQINKFEDDVRRDWIDKINNNL